MSSSDTRPGVYPGNPSLPREVREKILSTFRHTLNLYKEGKIDDCLLGCDFILKMDARFAPARSLIQKAKNPSADVDVAELESLVAETLTRQERAVAAEPDRLLVRAVESYNARDFDAAAAAAEQVLQVLPGNQDAVEILDKARRKKAAQPQVEAARQKTVAALGANRFDEARKELERMRALDPDHPSVTMLESKLAAAPPAGPALPDLPSLGMTFGQESEPHIAFDDGATMAIRLDDLPPPVAPVRPPLNLSGTSPLKPRSQAPAAAPVPPPPPPLRTAPPALDGLDALSLDSLSLDMPASPGPRPESPADMWREPSGGVELEPPAAPSGAATPELEPIEETEASHSERDIANLLTQGDEAAKRGDRQQAIEIWSRIFLIDINNSEAVTRIERSRQDMAEGNRKVADWLKTGREAFNAGDQAVAREMFMQVLLVDENEPTAKFYLDRIEEALAAPATAASGPASAGAGKAATAVAAAREAAAPGRGSRLPFPSRILLPVLVFILLAGGGAWYVMHQPGPKSAPPTLAPTRARIDDAATLVRDGKTNEAIAILKAIPATDPDYPRATRMLDQISKAASETTAAAASAGTPAPGAAPAGGTLVAEAAALEPPQLRAVAEKALAEKRYIDALKNFNLALPAYRSDPTFAQGLGSAAEKVTEIMPAVRLFNEGEYETAIPVLWRILQEDRENRDARSYLLRCYYNQGVAQLQNGLFPKARKSFDEVLSLDPRDAEAQRHRQFAARYLKTDLDLMGRIYVRHIPHRP
ncbi:MAG: hypothetical protein ACRD00_02430 [Thermoanaerobaculia bacterium]